MEIELEHSSFVVRRAQCGYAAGRGLTGSDDKLPLYFIMFGSGGGGSFFFQRLALPIETSANCVSLEVITAGKLISTVVSYLSCKMDVSSNVPFLFQHSVDRHTGRFIFDDVLLLVMESPMLVELFWCNKISVNSTITLNHNSTTADGRKAPGMYSQGPPTNTRSSSRR